MRKLFTIFIWWLIFTIASVMLSFNGYLPIDGPDPPLSTFNTIISICYLVTWFILSIWAGSKKKKEVLIGAIIYSAHPLVFSSGLFSLPLPGFIKSFLTLVMVWWGAPLRGLIFDFAYTYIFVLIQPVLFIIGYIMGTLIIKSKKNSVPL